MPSYSPSPAMQSGMQAQVNFLTELTSRTYGSLRRLSELNLHLAQQLVQDSADATRQMAACTDAFQLAAAAARAVQPLMHHLHAYQQQLAGMLSGAQVELARGAQSMVPEGARYAAAAMLQGTAREADSPVGPFPHAAHADGSAASHHTPG